MDPQKKSLYDMVIEFPDLPPFYRAAVDGDRELLLSNLPNDINEPFREVLHPDIPGSTDKPHRFAYCRLYEMVIGFPDLADLPLFNRPAVEGDVELAPSYIFSSRPFFYREVYFSRTALHLALYRGKLVTVQTLLDRGASVDVRDELGRTPLHWASIAGSTAAAQLLLDHGADVTVRDIYQQTPLHCASDMGNTAVAQLLLDHGAEVNVRDNKKDTPLHWASNASNTAVAQLLLDRGADISARDKEQLTPLHSASALSDTAFVQLLLDRGADTSARDKEQKTPLHLASAANDDTSVVQLLLDRGADISVRDRRQKTPLHLASDTSNTAVVQLLLDRGADVNARDRRQRTPLHWASCTRDTVKLLLDHGADITTRDRRHRTPVQMALNMDTLESASLMVSMAASPQQTWVQKLVTIGSIAKDTQYKQVQKSVLTICADMMTDKDISIQDDRVLDWSDLGLTNTMLKDKLQHLPKDFTYQALFIHNNQISILPNLLSWRQLHSLSYLVLSDNPIHTVEGLPPQLKGLYCYRTEIKVLGKACFHHGFIDVLENALIDARQYNSLTQPPTEVFDLGLEDILRYFTKEFMTNSQYRVVAIGDTGAGKSSCLESVILGKPYLTREADRTHVLDLKNWRVNDEDFFTFFDQGGHEVYDITNPYFVSIRSMVLIFQDLFETKNIPRTLDILRRSLHHHPQNAIHFVLTHIDQVDQVKQSVQSFKKEIQELLQGEISTFQRLLASPKNKGYIQKKDVQSLLEHCQKKQSTIRYFPISSKTYEGIEELKTFLKSTIEKQRVNIPTLWIDCHQKIEESKVSFWTKSKLFQVMNVNQSDSPASQSDSPVTQSPSPASQSDSPVTQSPSPASQSDSPVTQSPSPASQSDSPVTQSPSPASQSDSPVTQSPSPARQSSSPAIQSDSPAIQSDSPAIQSDSPAIQSDSPAIQSDSPASQSDSPASDHNKGVVQSVIGHDEREVLDCLRYLNAIGMVIWMEDHDTLNEYIFHDIEFLIEVFMSLFHHDLKSTIQYETDLHLQSVFTETEFEDALKKYQGEGILKLTFLQYLWKKYGLHENEELALIALIKCFHLFSEIPSDPEIPSDQDREFFVPWFVKKNKVPPNFNVNDPLVINSKEVSLNMECLFHNRLPLNVTEHFLVEVQGYMCEQGYLGKRYAWADGLQVQIDETTITAFRNVEQATLSLVITAESDYLAEMWDSLQKLNESLKSILKSYHGSLRSHHSNCLHCKKVGICPVHRWLQDKVLPKRPFKDMYMRCDKDKNEKTVKIPAALVTRMPKDDKLEQRLETVRTYLQTAPFQIHPAEGVPSTPAQVHIVEGDSGYLSTPTQVRPKERKTAMLVRPKECKLSTPTQVRSRERKSLIPRFVHPGEWISSTKIPQSIVHQGYLRGRLGHRANPQKKTFKKQQSLQQTHVDLDESVTLDRVPSTQPQVSHMEPSTPLQYHRFNDRSSSQVNPLVQEPPVKLELVPVEAESAMQLLKPETLMRGVELIGQELSLQRSMLEQLTSKTDEISTTVKEKTDEISTTVKEKTDEISTTVKEKTDEISTTVKEKTDEISTTVKEKSDEISTTVKEKTDEISTTVKEKTDEISTTVKEKTDEISTTVKEKTDEISTTMKEKTDEISTTVKEKTEQLSSKVTEQTKEISSKVTEQVTEQTKEISSKVIDNAEKLITHIKLDAGSAVSLDLNCSHRVLKQHQSLLEENLDPDDPVLLQGLYSNQVLSATERSGIENDKQSLGKTKRLLLCVDKHEKKSPGTVLKFIEVLEKCKEGTINYYLAPVLRETLEDINLHRETLQDVNSGSMSCHLYPLW